MSSHGEIDDKLRSLLTGEPEVPEPIRRTANWLRDMGIWHHFSRNETVTSCQDAARRRNRLGHKGIPLWDELKSFLGEYEDLKGNTHVFVAHCRGDRELDLEKLRQALQAMGRVRRLAAGPADDIGMAYGTVNPFLGVDVQQIFDYELHRSLGVPGTVMTNAGGHTWAVEFDPVELVGSISGARWADIVQPQTETDDRIEWGVREPRPIGILTGNPCDSGLDLCTEVNSHIRRLLGKNALGDVVMPRILLVSAPQIGISMEMDIREAPLRRALIRATEELCAAGAKIVAHPAHTTHYFAADIAAQAAERGARFVSMADVTSARLHADGVTEVALLGTRYVTDLSQRWSVYSNALEGIKVHTPTPEGWQKIHNLAYEVQQRGLTPACFNWMRDLLRQEVPASCKHVVVAMTEFTPVVRHLKARGRQGKILVNPIDIYAEAIAREYLGLPRSE